MMIWDAEAKSNPWPDVLVSIEKMEDDGGCRREMFVIEHVEPCTQLRIGCLCNMDDHACEVYDHDFEACLEDKLELNVRLMSGERCYVTAWAEKIDTYHDEKELRDDGLTSIEFLLHYREILSNAGFRGWYPFEISVENQRIAYMFGREDSELGNQCEYLCAEFPRNGSSVRVEVPVVDKPCKRGYFDMVHPELRTYQLLITSPNAGELRIAIHYPEYDAMLPAMRLFRKDEKNYIQRFYPVAGMTEDRLKELLQQVDGQQRW